MGFERLIPPAVLRTIEPDCHRMSEWLRYFDCHFYRTHKHWREIADLKDLDDEALITHFVQRGWRERRGYSGFLHAFIDPIFYRERYPELGLKDDLDAVAHWMYEGFFEGRIPNSVTRDVVESEIHLFQPGKVASKAIEKALYAAGHRKLVLHLHFASGLITSYPDCNLSYPEAVNTPRNKVVRFITGLRDPFERIISGHFQANLSGVAVPPSGTSVEEVCGAIQDTAFSQHQIDNLLNWFEHKFYRDVDVFQYEFDPSIGYRVIEKNNLKIFLYRFENIACLAKPLGRFVGLDLQVEPTNTSREKPYSALYEAVVKAMRFPPEQVEYVLNSRLARHFYTAEEREQKRERWSATSRLERRSRASDSNAMSPPENRTSRAEVAETGPVQSEADRAPRLSLGVPFANVGYCVCCDRSVRFVADGPWLRDQYRCDNCGCIPRERALIYCIEKFFPSWRSFAIHESSPVPRGASRKLEQEARGYVASHWFPDVAPAATRFGVRCENLESLTFPEATFDLHVSQDVMEHIFDPGNAFREIARTLRPGGAHVFTTPLTNREKESERAALRHPDGRIEFLIKPPEYHGNPISEEGALVTMKWGFDITRWIHAWSGLFTDIVIIDSLDLGIRAEYIEVLISRKPPQIVRPDP